MRKEKLPVEEKESLADRLIRYVSTRDDEDFGKLTVTSLAKVFDINRFKLLREFKAEKKMKLETFLLQEKMFRCSFILMSGREITIEELAKLMGYCSGNYFTQVFKKYFGIEPGDYKEFKTRCTGIIGRSVGGSNQGMNSEASMPTCGVRR